MVFSGVPCDWDMGRMLPAMHQTVSLTKLWRQNECVFFPCSPHRADLSTLVPLCPPPPPDVEGLGQKCAWQGKKQDHYCCLKTKLHWQQQNLFLLSLLVWCISHHTAFVLYVVTCYVRYRKARNLRGCAWSWKTKSKTWRPLLLTRRARKLSGMTWSEQCVWWCLIPMETHWHCTCYCWHLLGV